MLDQAELLAHKGLLPAEQVKAIRRGTGKLDQAQDGVALADLYASHVSQLKGKHPFTKEDFAELREASEWLLDHLTTGGARKPAAKPTPAEDLRDRLWTLVATRYSDLRVLAFYRHREEVDAKVPKLNSRELGPRAKSTNGEAAEKVTGNANGEEKDETKGKGSQQEKSEGQGSEGIE